MTDVQSNDEQTKEAAPKPKKKRSGILTAWLAVLIIFNAAEAIYWGGSALFLVVYEQSIDWEEAIRKDKEALEEAQIETEFEFTAEEMESFFYSALVWPLTLVLVRLASAGFLVWLFFWKKIAFWCYFGSVAAVFIVNFWWGYTASIDLIGLAILIALFNVGKPSAWRQLE